MNHIIATYVSECDKGKCDGSGRLLCPFCGKVTRERDIEKYTEEGSGRFLELCTNCRESFEQDLDHEFASDTLAESIFVRIWEKAAAGDKDNTGLNETTAEQVAKTLGGAAWQSGGGIWLVVFKRRDGRIIVISEEVVAEYHSEEELDSGEPSRTMLLI